ncbi:MAG: dihydrodipicolinate synthase family protein [Candidatus Hydrogenedentes bacterium]|nr:dihydrodipicolinate synthase family protein [Candidatus Hydrogenedentota bacterium]
MSYAPSAIEGVLPAFVTPFDNNGSVNVPMIRVLVARHLEEGCNGFFVCGSTGEGLLLDSDERKLVARTVIETVAGAVPVIVHVGAMSTREAAALAQDARKAGAAAVSSVPPIYFRVGLTGMMEHIRAIASAAELPTYYYHIPMLTGVELTGDELVQAFLNVEGVVGLKFTHTDMYFLWTILDAARGRLRVFNGADQMLFHGLCTGACGGIGSTYNYQMRTMVGIYQAFRRGDFETARKLQWRANQVIRVLFRNGGNIATEKAILKLQGFDVGIPRSPIVPFPEERLGELRRQLDEVGFFEY